MIPNPDDTIVGLSSPAGPGGRGIVRLSGTEALAVTSRVFEADNYPVIGARGVHSGRLQLSGLPYPIAAELYVFPGPASFTGQTVVELHLVSSPPILERLVADLLLAGARAAQPGEFTLRSFLAGKTDLTRAEAALGVIEAGSREELQRSLRQLAGGVSRPLEGLRGDLLDLLADLEAGLDFVDEDIEFVDKRQAMLRLSRALAQVTLVQKQVDARDLTDRPFRAALVGPPNAGKSRLFNALSGSQALVSPIPGTTRDYLLSRLDIDGTAIELVDTAGLHGVADAEETVAQALGRDAAAEAHLVLYCHESVGAPDAPTIPAGVWVATKCDLAEPREGWLATSATTGAGLEKLRSLLVSRARAHAGRGIVPSLSRCRNHVAACLERLRRAHKGVTLDDPPEVVALDLREALEQLGALTGEVHTDDLLDRVFSRFCIGK
jgi:tRNA modification GTPase